MKKKAYTLILLQRMGKKADFVADIVTYLIKNEKRCQETLFSPFFFVSLPYKTNNSHNLWEKVKKVAKE